jgi:hypothetical protein
MIPCRGTGNRAAGSPGRSIIAEVNSPAFALWVPVQEATTSRRDGRASVPPMLPSRLNRSLLDKASEGKRKAIHV